MRRRARECALQILYQLDVQAELDVKAVTREQVSAAIDRYWDSFEEVSADEREYAERLAHGVAGAVAALDAAIAKVSHHWKLSRMDKVDKNLIRLAAYEILHCPDVPRTVAINEALEIARRFGGGESVAFINGVLDQFGREPAGGGKAGGEAAKS
ncbi:MAG: transcription antitermination factor NusB [Deltaproteobacteria bacterium]|nr:transcription antitermination factor NusB [Deltaproteobacteria bacterium]